MLLFSSIRVRHIKYIVNPFSILNNQVFQSLKAILILC